MFVPLQERQNILLGLVLGDREGGIDIDLVGGGDFIQHDLKGAQVGQGLTPGEDEVAPGGDGVHPPDAGADLLQGEARHIRVFLFINTEGAVIFAVVGDEDRHRGAALPGLIGMCHDLIGLS